MVSYPSRFIKLAVFFEPNAEGSLRPNPPTPNVGAVGVVLTRAVVDGAAQFLFRGFVLGVNEHFSFRPTFQEHLFSFKTNVHN